MINTKLMWKAGYKASSIEVWSFSKEFPTAAKMQQ